MLYMQRILAKYYDMLEAYFRMLLYRILSIYRYLEGLSIYTETPIEMTIYRELGRDLAYPERLERSCYIQGDWKRPDIYREAGKDLIYTRRLKSQRWLKRTMLYIGRDSRELLVYIEKNRGPEEELLYTGKI